MPELRCNVNNCVHNSNRCCELGEIAVKGVEAENADCTCCSTFCECSESLKNEHVDRQIPKDKSIMCSAEKCQYNQNCHCNADEIDICGCNANRAENTACSTFSCR